jgi:hypothetical protein
LRAALGIGGTYAWRPVSVQSGIALRTLAWPRSIGRGMCCRQPAVRFGSDRALCCADIDGVGLVEFVIAGMAVVLVTSPFVYPRWRKWEIAREKRRNPRKVSAGGLVAPFDEVFHPTAYSAILVWEAEKSIPAPTPDADSNWPLLDSGRITICLRDTENRD